jgi:hypothetical protein
MPTAIDQVSTNRRHPGKRARGRRCFVPRQRASCAEVGQERLPRSLTWTDDHRVRMTRGLIGKRARVQTAHAHVRAARAIRMRDLPRTTRRCDVHAHHEQVGLVIELERRVHVLVEQLHLV